MSGVYIHSPNMSSWRGAQLKHRDNFTLTDMFIYVSRWTDQPTARCKVNLLTLPSTYYQFKKTGDHRASKRH
jgi:hypothetical protein